MGVVVVVVVALPPSPDLLVSRRRPPMNHVFSIPGRWPLSPVLSKGNVPSGRLGWLGSCIDEVYRGKHGCTLGSWGRTSED